MPELPEIEVLRRDLERDLVGRKIKSVEVDGLKPIRRHRTKKAFTGLLDGHKITGVERRGRYLLIRLDGPDVLLVDLGPTGSLVRAKTARTAVTKGTHVVITFTQGGQLRYSDPKVTGEMFVTPLEGIADEVSEIAAKGLDPLEASISWIDFGRLIAGRHAKLKALLMDASVLTGIGPVYSDEILFAAGLRWDRESDSLTDQEIRRLYRAIVETVQEAVKYAGSRAANNSDGDGVDHTGSGENHRFKVYEREGEACRRCRRPLVKLRVGNRPVFFCEACQV
ncbi:MAG TPA: DNA-formamidopyrimidine glycosylase family protein [Acidimicrobiia bacterium]|nr:DNA-formamidopyrimidine glycosylase family protein [Acidimicrobiia bacterium]